MKYRCAHCGKTADKAAGHVKRARNRGLNLYCDRKCSGLGRRDGKTKAQRVEEKRLYDMEYRAANLPSIKAKKQAHFKKTYDPVKAAIERKKKMPRHVEYCRRPEYRVKKSAYDKKRRADEYGDFAEAFLLTQDLNREIKGRMSNEQISHANGNQNKTQRRRRATAEEKPRSRVRHRKLRAASHSATHGW